MQSSFDKLSPFFFRFVHPARNWSGAVAAALTAPWRRLPAAIAASALPVPAAARTALGLRTGFVDVQRSSIEVFTVESIDCGIPFGIDAHFDEGESSGLAGVAIRHDIDALNGSIRIKHGPEGIFGRPETEITYKNILHFFSFLNLQSS
jgi:hypothetical protein